MYRVVLLPTDPDADIVQESAQLAGGVAIFIIELLHYLQVGLRIPENQFISISVFGAECFVVELCETTEAPLGVPGEGWVSGEVCRRRSPNINLSSHIERGQLVFSVAEDWPQDFPSIAARISQQLGL